jgi:monofunctional biosynthetic peptidoglycan transglycosylase
MIKLPMNHDFHRFRDGFPRGAKVVGFGVYLALVLALRLSGNFVMAQELVTVVDFSSPNNGPRWRVVNDGVMGGLSQSRMNLTSEQTGVFEGTVSLENNGGFASVRTEPTDLGLGGFRGLELRVKGDGKLYQLRLRTGPSRDGIAYRATFDTSAGEWTTVRFDFTDFAPSYRGRAVPSAPALGAGRIRQLGILISDKQEGKFRLEIDSIKAYR